MNTEVKVASFYEAFKKFLSYSDGSLKLNALASFGKLSQEKVVSFRNETVFWHGNHSQSNSSAELVMVETPCLFFVVKFHYDENSDSSKSWTETTIFVPNEF
jgi:hypothetical protein